MAVDKSKALETALGQIEKQFGKGAVMRLGQNEAMHVDAIPTGSLSLDLALGIGGLPRGRIVEIYTGIRQNYPGASLYRGRTKKRRLRGLYRCRARSGSGLCQSLGRRCGLPAGFPAGHREQALEITEALVRSGAIDVIVVDSVAALVPRAEIEGEMGDSMYLYTRLMSQA